jgi:hypothetical protein
VAGGRSLPTDPLLKLLPDIVVQVQEADATSLPGFVRPHHLSIRFNGRGVSGKREFQVAAVAFDNGPNDLAAQASFADVQENSTAVRAKSDIGQLIEPPAQMGSAFCDPWGLCGADGS